MARIAIFDSGLGSLSIINPIQKKIKTEIIYFADQKSYPYGTKSARQLQEIIESTIKKLRERFKPDLIVVASNTPSLLLHSKIKGNVLGVYPPLREAARITSTRKIAVLATRSVINSNELQNYIKDQVTNKVRVFCVNASPLVEMVESGKFISDYMACKKKIRKNLQLIQNEGVDIATLSSTHLPFLLPMLKEEFPGMTFLDPADCVAEKVAKMLKGKKGQRQRLIIYATGNIKKLEKKLRKLRIKNKVHSL